MRTTANSNQGNKNPKLTYKLDERRSRRLSVISRKTRVGFVGKKRAASKQRVEELESQVHHLKQDNSQLRNLVHDLGKQLGELRADNSRILQKLKSSLV